MMKRLNASDQWICMAEDKDVHELELLASKLSVRARRRLLSHIDQEMDRPRIRALERTRVALAKLLIATVPDSWKIIRRLIAEPSGTKTGDEVRFSLFCFLDHVPYLTGGRKLTSEAACLVGDYLRCAVSNRGHAAWMAGDLLGDHWDVAQSVPILIDILATGKYAAGRLAALHGLEHAKEKADCADTIRESICRAIRQAARDDRSGRVRESAKRICRRVGACSQKAGKGSRVVVIPHFRSK